MDIYEEIVRLMRNGRTGALATIVQSSGSCPQKEGAKMLVRDDGSFVGTLGGGSMESQLVQAARQAIKEEITRTIPIMLNEQHGGHVCGGRLQVFIEPLVPPPHLVIVGAGHVGKALANVARLHGYHISIIDDRPAFASRDNIPAADEWIVEDYASGLKSIAIHARTYVLIATRSHDLDFNAASATLGTQAAYIGMIGSKRKKAVLDKKLNEAGFDRDAIARIITPVGLEIDAVTPEEIAISIMAQIIAHRRKRGNKHFGDHSGRRALDTDGQTQAIVAVERDSAD